MMPSASKSLWRRISRIVLLDEVDRRLEHLQAGLVVRQPMILAGELDQFGRTLDQVWQSKRAISPLIATEEADIAYEVALSAGALGGKIAGAGGGGFMLFYAPFRSRFEVAQALRELGHEVLDVALDDVGLQSWSHD